MNKKLNEKTANHYLRENCMGGLLSYRKKNNEIMSVNVFLHIAKIVLELTE